MNSKKTTLLGLSIGAIFTILVFGAAFQSVEAAKPNALGKPDFIAKLNSSGLPGSQSDAIGQAQFWFDEDGNGDLTLKYNIMLHKMTWQDDPKGAAADEILTKMHVHYAPNGVHNPVHLFNIMGPENDTLERVIVETPGNIIVMGEWDNDESNLICPSVDNHHHFIHSSKTFDCEMKYDATEFPAGNDKTVLENLCSGQTDLNIHTNLPGSGAVNGILVPKSDACDELLVD
jgi:hypothetical protein